MRKVNKTPMRYTYRSHLLQLMAHVTAFQDKYAQTTLYSLRMPINDHVHFVVGQISGRVPAACSTETSKSRMRATAAQCSGRCKSRCICATAVAAETGGSFRPSEAELVRVSMARDALRLARPCSCAATCPVHEANFRRIHAQAGNLPRHKASLVEGGAMDALTAQMSEHVALTQGKSKDMNE